MSSKARVNLREAYKWLELNKVAKLLLQPTKLNTVLTFTLASVLLVVRKAAQVAFSPTVS
jgi:hypothetical protein